MTSEQKQAVLETFRKLSLAAFEIGRKAELLHQALEALHQKIEDAN